jgi:hypothetical protein
MQRSIDRGMDTGQIKRLWTAHPWDKAPVYHLVRNCDVARLLYGALQPPNRFIDPVFLTLGLNLRLFTTN